MTDNDGRELITTKDVEQMQAQSIQARARDEGAGRMPLLMFLARAGQTIPAWWSKERDRELDRFWKNSDHVGGAFFTLSSKLTSVPFRIEARDPNVASHRKLAEEYQDLLEAGSEFGLGWQELIVPFLLDLWSQDNGAFLEVIGGGPKSGPVKGLPVGLAHLDSYRCHRTGSLEFPVQYEDYDGKLYKLHRSRVLYRSQMPSARAEMYKVGFCWLSRCINAAQGLIDDLTYKQEKIGSRPKRGIIVTKGGLDPDDMRSAFEQADIMMDSQGLSKFSKFVTVGANYLPDAALDILDLASLPDGFDYETDVTLAMYTIALTGAVPPRWLWPATVSGATKADAMYQHVAGLTGGPGATLKMLAGMLGGPVRGAGTLPGLTRFLPASLRMVFDFQDDEQDRTAAEIAEVRSQARERDISAGAISVRVAREIMVEDGELSEEQFEELELEEGRLEDGSDVLALFQSDDPAIMALLPVDPDAATDEEIQERMQENWAIALNSANANQKRKARQANAALQKLLDERKAEPLEETGLEEERPLEEEPTSEDETPMLETSAMEEGAIA